MINRLLISVATAALFAGTGLANAQGTGMSKEQPGATMQDSAPSGAGATDRDTGMKGTEHSTKGEAAGTEGAESEKMNGPESEKGQTGASGKSAQDKSKSTEHETKGKDMKTEGREKGGTVGETRDKSGGTSAESREKGGGMETQKGATDTSRSQTTTGAATAGPPAEKRTEIVSAIKSEKIEEAANVNVNLSVGATLPTSVRLHPLPPKIVEIYPEWRGYEVILVKGRYVIVKPETHEIVYIIEG